jgi:hypothetical protein
MSREPRTTGQEVRNQQATSQMSAESAHRANHFWATLTMSENRNRNSGNNLWRRRSSILRRKKSRTLANSYFQGGSHMNDEEHRHGSSMTHSLNSRAHSSAIKPLNLSATAGNRRAACPCKAIPCGKSTVQRRETNPPCERISPVPSPQSPVPVSARRPLPLSRPTPRDYYPRPPPEKDAALWVCLSPRSPDWWMAT